jgi:hypothetical protein
MQLVRDHGTLALAAQRYSLFFPADRPFVYLDDREGARVAELFVLSSVHPMDDRDDTFQLGEWSVEESEGQVTFSLPVQSSVWKSKTIRFCCEPRRFTYTMQVEGAGALAEVDFFGGYSSATRRWGSGFFYSGHHFKRGFNPEPNADEIYYFPPSTGSTIDLTGVPLPGKSTWFFTPSPFCYAFEGKSGWIAVGVQAARGANRFTEFAYHGQLTSFHLSLAYEGHTHVDRAYALPAISFDFGKDEEGVYSAYMEGLAGADALAPTRPTRKPEWWREPIFCGWGAQTHLAAGDSKLAAQYATQEKYELFISTLEEHGIQPGTIVLDDKWQQTYGENCVDPTKWHDIKGFVAKQHAAGRKVLLWLQAWSAEGLPIDECITNAGGLALSCDPSNPAYERRLRASIRSLLSPYGYDADGFKIDFTARIPTGPGLRVYGDTWGLELMRLYLGIIYDEAKKAKEDALIITQTPNPYLADVVDMIRLNDINKGKDINRAMRQRTRIAALACPDALIDTDNWPMTNKAAWRDYTRLQPELGVPSLYYVSHIDTTQEPFDEEDYRLIRQTWAEYRARLQLEIRDWGLRDATKCKYIA